MVDLKQAYSYLRDCRSSGCHDVDDISFESIHGQAKYVKGVVCFLATRYVSLLFLSAMILAASLPVLKSPGLSTCLPSVSCPPYRLPL